MSGELVQGLYLALLAAFIGGWGSVWWKLGKLEGRINGTTKEWSALKAICPLCPKRETKSQEELHQEVASGRDS